VKTDEFIYSKELLKKARKHGGLGELEHGPRAALSQTFS